MLGAIALYVQLSIDFPCLLKEFQRYLVFRNMLENVLGARPDDVQVGLVRYPDDQLRFHCNLVGLCCDGLPGVSLFEALSSDAGHFSYSWQKSMFMAVHSNLPLPLLHVTRHPHNDLITFWRGAEHGYPGHHK